jgi:hypothetical protein
VGFDERGMSQIQTEGDKEESVHGVLVALWVFQVLLIMPREKEYKVRTADGFGGSINTHPEHTTVTAAAVSSSGLRSAKHCMLNLYPSTIFTRLGRHHIPGLHPVLLRQA